MALGAALWGVLELLALVEGLGDRVFSLPGIGAHVRLLVAVPLFFVCETLLDPRLDKFAEDLKHVGVLPVRAVPALQAELARTMRWTDSWLPEAACLLTALALLMADLHLPLYGATSGLDPSRESIQATLTGHWYFGVCLTIVRFLILRWLWRIGLWCRFLWRLSRLDMHLVPTHPDRQAGLGYLQTVQAQFAPLILAISAIQAASFAEDIAVGKMQFEAIAPALLLLLGVQALVFLGPLLILAPQLRAARLAGLENYMALASRYVNAFEVKWLQRGAEPGESILGTPDLQSLADLQNSLRVIEEMKWIPVSRRLLIGTLLAGLFPMVPLILFKYPITELSQKLLTGLLAL